jgi:hypothetical protein
VACCGKVQEYLEEEYRKSYSQETGHMEKEKIITDNIRESGDVRTRDFPSEQQRYV